MNNKLHACYNYKSCYVELLAVPDNYGTTCNHSIHKSERRSNLTTARPGKVDSLFLISHFLNLRAGRRSLFIIHYYYIIKILGNDHRKSNEYLLSESKTASHSTLKIT